MRKIEIPKFEVEFSDIPNMYFAKIKGEDWVKLVKDIQRVNEEVEGMTKVYLGLSYINVNMITKSVTEHDKYYAYITKPKPSKQKTKEERAMEIIDELADSNCYGSLNKADLNANILSRLIEKAKEIKGL